MANKSPAYRWYPRDILGSLRVAAMTAAEECWYRRALDFAWLNHGIPSDPVKLSRIIGKKCTVRGAETVLTMFQPSDDPNVVISERQELERQKQKQWSEKSAEGGRASRPPNKPEPESKTEPPLQPNVKQKGTLQFAVCGDSSEEELREAAVAAALDPLPEPEPDPTPKTDPRKNHPAIIAIRETAGIYPPKEIWDDVIDSLGLDIDIPKLKKAFVKWRAKGFNKVNYAGWIEWYNEGIPDFRGKTNGTNQQHSNKPTPAERIANRPYR